MDTAQTTKQHLTIGEAADVLGVSIDTLRRWEKIGRISATRSAGGIRLFPRTEVDRLLPEARKFAKHLTVSQAATYLGVSPTTLRRWDRQELLKPERTIANERVYEESALVTFIENAKTPLLANPVTNPVQYIKEKASEISDTVYIGMLNRTMLTNIFSRCLLGLIAFGAIALLAKTTSQQAVTTAAIASPAVTAMPITGNPVENDWTYYAGNVSSQTATVGYLRVMSDRPVLLSQTNSMSDTIGQNTNTPISQTASWTITNLPTPNQDFLQNSPELVHPTQAGFSTGNGTVTAGAISSNVKNTALTSDAKVFISFTNAILPYAIKKNPGVGFTVIIAKPTDQPVTFDWLVIE